MPGVSNAALLEKLKWQGWNSLRGWREEVDDKIRDEVISRSMGPAEARRQGYHVPPWLDVLIPGSGANKVRFVALVLASHRAGQIGLLASQGEIASRFNVHPVTVYRWAKDLEAQGVLEVIQTWRRKGKSNERGYWKLLYRPGPMLRDAVGLAILRAAPDLVGRRAVQAKRAYDLAAARAQKYMRERQDANWHRENDRKRTRKSSRSFMASVEERESKNQPRPEADPPKLALALSSTRESSDRGKARTSSPSLSLCNVQGPSLLSGRDGLTRRLSPAGGNLADRPPAAAGSSTPRLLDSKRDDQLPPLEQPARGASSGCNSRADDVSPLELADRGDPSSLDAYTRLLEQRTSLRVVETRQPNPRARLLPRPEPEIFSSKNPKELARKGDPASLDAMIAVLENRQQRSRENERNLRLIRPGLQASQLKPGELLRDSLNGDAKICQTCHGIASTVACPRCHGTGREPDV
ncbi:MAG: hypothetical protein B7733_09445 [Myxococcales bacterium FL481]|nr:MAG: hypothetical protein B7733_09445 [Myxococcales bacterium FL481]